MNNKGRVDIVGVGFPKCGTTWVADMLADHPEIDFAKHKESNYFIREDAIEGLMDNIDQVIKIKTMDRYKKLFKNDGRIKGEYSVLYAYSKEALEKIYLHNPDVKILISTRDPVDALFSRYRFTKNSAYGADLPPTFKELVESNSEWFKKYYKQYDYSVYLENIEAIFPKENVYRIEFDDIKNDPATTLENLYNYVGVSKDHVPQKQASSNKTGAPRSMRMNQLGSKISRILMRLGLYRMVQILYRLNLRYNKVDAPDDTVDSSTRTKLVESYSHQAPQEKH